MDGGAIGIILSTIAAAIGTPLIMKLWGRWSPPTRASEFDSVSKEELRRRNNWIDNVACSLALIGIFSPLLLYANGMSNRNPWPVGLGFGLMVILPVAFVSMFTLPQGFVRFREFWRFYELKYGIGVRGITYVFVPIAVLGIASIYKLVF